MNARERFDVGFAGMHERKLQSGHAVMLGRVGSTGETLGLTGEVPIVVWRVLVVLCDIASKWAETNIFSCQHPSSACPY